ncbi:MAG: type-F conjugative transfer system secretin TraK [Anaerolineae bacterium]
MPHTTQMNSRATSFVIAALVLTAGCLMGPVPTTARPAGTRVIPWSGEAVTVRIAQGRTTSVAFPAQIASLVTTAGKDALSLETAGSRLYLTPLTPDYSGEVFVVLTTGEQVPLLAVSGDPETADLSVHIISEKTRAQEALQQAARRWTPLRLLRAMILNIEEAGVTVTDTRPPAVVYNDSILVLRVFARWRTPRYEGVILEAENRTEHWLRLALESLRFPGLLAVHAERETLAPTPSTAEERLAGREKSRVYLVRVPE